MKVTGANTISCARRYASRIPVRSFVYFFSSAGNMFIFPEIIKVKPLFGIFFYDTLQLVSESAGHRLDLFAFRTFCRHRDTHDADAVLRCLRFQGKHGQHKHIEAVTAALNTL